MNITHLFFSILTIASAMAYKQVEPTEPFVANLEVSAETLDITAIDGENYSFTVSGTIDKGWPNSDPKYLMTFEDGYYVAYNVPLKRANEIWSDQNTYIQLEIVETGSFTGWGKADDIIHSSGEAVEVGRVDASGILFDIPTGEYDVYFNYREKKVWVMKPGMKPGEKEDVTPTGDLKVMSYNIRYDNPYDGKNQWTNRKSATKVMLETIMPDVFGIQEADSNQEQYILTNVPMYNKVGVGNADGIMSIFWNTETVRLLDYGTFWLSETPDVPSVGWDAAMNRSLTWALMKDERNDQLFYFMNTHLDHIGPLARLNGVLLIVDRLDDINPEGYPMVLVGDFNASPAADCMIELDKHMSCTRKIADKTDAELTFNSWGRAGRGSMIDYIYISNFQSVPEYRTVTEQFDGIPYISDHYPILSILKY